MYYLSSISFDLRASLVNQKLRGVGIEPTRIAPADLKPASLTTRTSSPELGQVGPAPVKFLVARSEEC